MRKRLDALKTLALHNKETRVEVAMQSLQFFAWYYFGIYLHKAQRKWARRFLSSKKAMVMAPRGHGKTELMKIIIIWLICKNRNVRILITSLSDPQATKLLRVIKAELEINAKLIMDYGSFYEYGNHWAEKSIFVKRSKTMKDATVEAVGIFSSITGGRFDYIIFDDMIDIKAVREDKQRLKIISEFEETFIPLLEPWGCAWVVGTRKHFGDIYGQLIRNPSWVYIIDQAIIEEPKDFEIVELDEPKIVIIDDEEIEIIVDVVIKGDDHGKCLWPDHMPMEFLLALRYSLKPIAFNREYQNVVISDEFALFKMCHLEACRCDTLSYINHEMTVNEAAEYDFILQGVDPALVTDKATAETHDSSFMVDITIGATNRGKADLLHIHRERGLTPAQVSGIIKKLYYQFDPAACAIERNSFGEFHIANLIEETDLRIVKHHTGGNKRDPYKGVPSLAVAIENRKFRFPYKTAADRIITDKLTDELHALGVGEHTDQIMALWIVYTLLTRMIAARRKHRQMASGRPTTKRKKRMVMIK